MIVVDTSVIAEILLNSPKAALIFSRIFDSAKPRSAAAHRHRDRQHPSPIHAPGHIRRAVARKCSMFLGRCRSSDTVIEICSIASGNCETISAPTTLPTSPWLKYWRLPARHRRRPPRQRRRDSAPRSKSSERAAHRIHLQRRDERLLRDLHLAELAHALLAGFLLLEQLALARRVAAVAFCGHVLAQRADRLAGDDLAADRRLHGDLEHVRRDQLSAASRPWRGRAISARSRCTSMESASTGSPLTRIDILTRSPSR